MLSRTAVEHVLTYRLVTETDEDCTTPLQRFRSANPAPPCPSDPTLFLSQFGFWSLMFLVQKAGWRSWNYSVPAAMPFRYASVMFFVHGSVLLWKVVSSDDTFPRQLRAHRVCPTVGWMARAMPLVLTLPAILVKLVLSHHSGIRLPAITGVPFQQYFLFCS